jgi:orotate phosphoribosyltransferase
MQREKSTIFNSLNMQDYKKEFIEFLVRQKVLKFGDFTLKSGRKCPYFLNFGEIHSGESITKLGEYYAKALDEHIKDFNVIFGPAYKGIPISVTTAIAYARMFGKNIDYAYNRKEIKDHGEGGGIVGVKVSADSKVVILDDVMTAGSALRESLEIMKEVGNPEIKGVLIAADRMEKGKGEKSAIQEVKEEFGIDVYSIVDLNEIIEYLHGREIDGEIVLDDEKVAMIDKYRKEYGV